MRIDKLAISAYPRNRWQAIDLGCRLTTTWWPALMSFWLLVTLPIFILCCLVSLEYGVLLFWWLKPLCERGLLYIFSQRMFGNQVSGFDAFKCWPSQLKNGWFASLTWLRFSPWRGFNLPVYQLEKIALHRRSDRLDVLHAGKSNSSGTWFFICAHWELFILIGFFAAISMLIPAGSNVALFDFSSRSNSVILILYNIGLYIAYALVAPYFIGGSFAGYINKRILLEGWDIELKFKQWMHSHHLKSVIVCMAMLTFLISPNDVFAQTEQQVDKEQQTQVVANIQDVESTHTPMVSSTLSDKEILSNIIGQAPFSTKVSKEGWRLKPSVLDEDEEVGDETDIPNWVKVLVSFIASSGEIVLWCCLLFLLFYITWLSRTRIKTLFSTQQNQVLRSFEMPTFATAHSPSVAPDKLNSIMSTYLDAGEYRMLLSVMLMASFSVLSREYFLPIVSSTTEQECLTILEKHLPADKQAFMMSLINTWVQVAWAYNSPHKEHMQRLVEEWITIFSDDYKKMNHEQ